MGMIFFPVDVSTLTAGVLHTPSLVGHQAEHHLTALPCTGHICREGFVFLLVPTSLCGSCDAQRGAWQGISFTPGSAEGGLCWFYGGVELVEQYKDTGAQGRIKANGLQLSAFL